MFRDVRFFVSGADVAGEGELKIVKYIRAVRDANPDPENTDSYLIVGSDADLVLLGSFIFGAALTQRDFLTCNPPSLPLVQAWLSVCQMSGFIQPPISLDPRIRVDFCSALMRCCSISKRNCPTPSVRPPRQQVEESMSSSLLHALTTIFVPLLYRVLNCS
jgi:hypothetical protein